jgi:hypothetical protein
MASFTVADSFIGPYSELLVTRDRISAVNEYS